MKKTIALVIIAALFAMSLAIALDTHEATGGSVTANLSKTYGAADSVTGYAGNISEFNISMEQETSFWAGFYGNVTHTLVLAGNTDNFYSWATAVDSTGAVFFANTSATIDWGNIAGTSDSHREAEDAALSMTGEVDSVNNTFTETNDAQIDLSDTENVGAAGAATVETLSSGGSVWETALLRQTTSATKIYAGIIQQNNENFAGELADFQVMVPVGNAGSRQYWIYAALA